MYILFSFTPPDDCLHEMNYSNSFFCPVTTCFIKDKISTIDPSINNDALFFFLSLFLFMDCIV